MICEGFDVRATFTLNGSKKACNIWQNLKTVSTKLYHIEKCHERVVRVTWLWLRVPIQVGPACNGKTPCEPSSKWVPFSNQRKIRQREEKNGLCLSYVVPKIQSAS